ncbi:hypothetical protein ABEF95_003082 [Exophiala dermatitidis]
MPSLGLTSDMEPFPHVQQSRTSGPMGFLNYPAEIMNRIYHELFIDHSHVLLFLCRYDLVFRNAKLKQLVPDKCSEIDDLYWSRLLDTQSYTENPGKSAQFLRVCKKIWLEGTPVLYGNVTIAMQTKDHPELRISEFFGNNAKYVLAWAKVLFPRQDPPVNSHLRGWRPTRMKNQRGRETRSVDAHLRNGRVLSRTSVRMGVSKKRSFSF